MIKTLEDVSCKLYKISFICIKEFCRICIKVFCRTAENGGVLKWIVKLSKPYYEFGRELSVSTVATIRIEHWAYGPCVR